MKTANYGWHLADATISVDYCARAISRHLTRLNCKTVLDIGCGNGAMTRLLQASGFQMTGIEPDRKGFDIASESVRDAKFYNLGVYDDTSVLGKFDAVIASEVIEHLYDPSALLSVAKNHLKDGGYLLLTCPHHGYVKNLLISLTNKWDQHFHPAGLGGHIKFWSHATMGTFLEKHGFDTEILSGAGRFWPIWKSMVVVGRKSRPDRNLAC
jgi:cyclopropane fatty-acyl-phospholipid synthase-like methyltransferase